MLNKPLSLNLPHKSTLITLQSNQLLSVPQAYFVIPLHYSATQCALLNVAYEKNYRTFHQPP